MQRGICIISETETEGYPIKEDFVISSLRKLKRIFGIARNNTLVVGRDSLEEYKKRRSKFEKTFVQYAAIAIILVLAIVVLPLLLGAPFSIGSVLMSMVIGALIIAFSLTSYLPAIYAEGEKEPKKQPTILTAVAATQKKSSLKKQKTGINVFKKTRLKK
ncbi:hypothetical protein COV61_01560 [Candidatus Micrarchaeota archaeon CG11_big_fil_rev_8_21_14_0_20_47_5]|nr:MAG: hypothetical protein AUJ17_01330 [Candidatus Micrarchaeota archaeon CG1_02_47_40]PIN83964.1 MAG: hypothetical protein COV61_01560 [Candidatus Micrarchaeota archaeon CG11_big_fil_rev_8_21_14_0_20_47_5]